jgi:hypothetical protein
MTQKEMRNVALSATRWYLQHMGIDPQCVSAEEAVSALDDYARLDHELVCSRWYATASEREIVLFEHDWVCWQRERESLGLV